MCEKEYINLQTGELLDLEKVSTLKDNAMLKVKPELWIEWDFEKNDDLGLDIWKMTYGSGKISWWLGKCGHEWDAMISNRRKGSGCPYCSGNKILIGFNDMWTTNHEMAKLLLNHEDGYRYGECSDIKLNWKCKCGHIIKNKYTYNVSKHGLSCPICSDGISYPEKLLYLILQGLDVDFNFQKSFNWSKNKRYDFYIASHNAIIEVHGVQHYKKSGFEDIGGRTLNEEQSNDKIKRKLASSNGVKHYIEINAEKTDIDWIKNSVLTSGLNKIFELNNLDWNDIQKKSLNSFIKSVCCHWEYGEKNVSSISKIFNLNRITVRKYLSKGAKVGWCNYNPERNKFKSVICLDTGERFEKMTDAMIKYKTNHIMSVCKRKRKFAGGLRWMYIEDYIKYIEEQNSKTA